MNTNTFRVNLNTRNRSIELQDGRVLCFETDNDIVNFVLIVDDAIGSAQYKLDVETKRNGVTTFNTISLAIDGTGKQCEVLLQAGMLFNGKNSCQFRVIEGDQVWLSDKFDIWVKKPILGYCDAYQVSNPLPSEFYQIESSLTELSNHPPKPSDDGYWMVWNTSIHDYEKSTVPFAGQSFTAGEGVDIKDNTISIKTDGDTIIFDDQGQLAFNHVDLGIIY